MADSSNRPLVICMWLTICFRLELVTAIRLPDPHHRQKGIYSLTEPAIQLVPLLAHMGAWGCRHTRPSRELSVRAQLLEKGGVALWDTFMDELRHLHLGAPRPARSVFGELRAAYEKALGRRTQTLLPG